MQQGAKRFLRPRTSGIREKNLQNSDSMQLEGGFGGIRSLHESGSTIQALHFLLAFHPFNIPVKFG